MSFACRFFYVAAAAVVLFTVVAVAGEAAAADNDGTTAMGLGIGGLSLGAGLGALARALQKMAENGLKHTHFIRLDPATKKLLSVVIRADSISDEETIDAGAEEEDDPSPTKRRTKAAPRTVD